MNNAQQALITLWRPSLHVYSVMLGMNAQMEGCPVKFLAILASTPTKVEWRTAIFASPGVFRANLPKLIVINAQLAIHVPMLE